MIASTKGVLSFYTIIPGMGWEISIGLALKDLSIVSSNAHWEEPMLVIYDLAVCNPSTKVSKFFSSSFFLSCTSKICQSIWDMIGYSLGCFPTQVILLAKVL